MNEKEIELLRICFEYGYELGHNNTVESCYCGGEQAWEDSKEEILRGLK